jgi:hypothetical protein
MEVPLRVALAQYPSGRDPAEIVAAAKAAAAGIVVFPEMAYEQIPTLGRKSRAA